ncbi:NAD(P)-binding protein [Halobacillus salinus]|uniref:precorrin-2 dehydrogenase n=1 Tax=Halobacillus salinus TaxID=192814 RepID=A0A4Z0H1B7_9BACI|nr:NAD(P)-binding protein [Halobacillus salinus]TGB03674.1 NAD(P)-binding protein [Halobacillus salinus]
MKPTPLMVDLTGKNAVIVGGGKVAEKRARVLVESGALVTIISPTITQALQSKIGHNTIEWKQKDFDSSDVQHTYLVVIATDDEGTNEQILAACEHVPLVNVASKAECGNLHFPGHFSRGKLSVAVSTNGASPMLTSRIKEELEQKYDEDYGAYVDFLFECRQLIKRKPFASDEKRLILQALLDEAFFDTEKQQELRIHIERSEEGGDMLEWIERKTSGVGSGSQV